MRDENLPKGKALNAIEVIIGECALEFTALYERDRVYLNFLWLVWFLDPAILDPPCDEKLPMHKEWAEGKKGWRNEMYWHAAHLAVTREFKVYDGTTSTCIAAIWLAVHNYPNDDDIQTYAGRVLVLIVKTLKVMSEGFVFIYMCPAAAVRDLAVTPTVWMQRVLTDIRLTWGTYASERLPFVVWAQLSALLCEDFVGWTTAMDCDDGHHDDNDSQSSDMDVTDDDEGETTCGPFPRATVEEMARRTLRRSSVRRV